MEQSTSVSKSAFIGMPKGRSINRALQDRPLRWPNEIKAQGSREQMRGFIIPARGAPFTIQRVNYWENPDNAGRYEDEEYK